MCNLINIHTYIHTYIHTPPWEDQCEWQIMTRITGPDCADMYNLININTNIHTYIRIHTYIHLGGSMRVAYNDSDGRAGLRGYVQFNKYTYKHTYIHTYITSTYIHTYINKYIHTYIHTYIFRNKYH